MCFVVAPAVMAAAMVVSAAAAAYSGYQAMEQGKEQKKQAERAARLADEAAQDEESRMRREAGQLAGDQIARMAANGLDVGFGSALRTVQDTKVLENEDAQRIRDAGTEQAFGFQIQGANAKAAGNAQAFNSFSSAATSLIGGASRFGGSSSFTAFRARNQTAASFAGG
jgi:hypothetical protein